MPVARGVPGEGYPHAWSVYRWIDGRPATPQNVADPTGFAVALAEFLVALARVEATDGPSPGPHNFFRGAPVQTYAHEVAGAIEALGDEIPRGAVERVWEDAIAARWDGEPVWFHGDVAAGNLLVRNGRLAAVIDFGCSGVGDPACDVVIAWTFLSGPSRDAFRSARGVDSATWSRGRGWALWKALITLVGALEADDGAAAAARRREIDRVIADHAGDDRGAG